MKPKFYLFIKHANFSITVQWMSFDLESFGNSLDELVYNAVYYRIDQEGKNLGCFKADDNLAIKLIESWYIEQLKLSKVASL